MKNRKVYPLLISCLLLSGIALAQQSFNSKKKAQVNVNTSQLHAKQIKFASSSSSSVKRKNSSFNKFSLAKGITNQGPHRILYSDQNDIPRFIQTDRNTLTARVISRTDPRTGCFDYLNQLKPILGIESPEQSFEINNIKTDVNNRTHIKLQQLYKGVPVYGGEVAVHLSEFNQGEAFNGRYKKLAKDIDVVPSVSANDAMIRVVENSKLKSSNHIDPLLVQYADPVSSLCIYEPNGLIKTPVLAYHVIYCPTVHERLEYFIDAHTGNVLNKFNTICFADGPRTANANDLNGVSRKINTYQKGSTYFMVDVSRTMFQSTGSTLPDEPVGGIQTIDLNNTFGDNQAFKHVTSTTNTWANATAVSAHFNAGFAYEYYLSKHNRNSIDGNGGTIISIINTTDENGAGLDNAFWNGKAMFYGNGKTSFKALAGGLDVAGHEMTHGVVQNTANLEYQGESGAINESMADIFGSMMDPSDWLIGEDVVKLSAFPSGALRSLSDPHNGGSSLNDPGFQPSHMNEKYNGSEDNGGVHVNSGIANKAFFLYATAITRDKAIAVYYKALDDYLTKSSQFIDLRLAVIKAAGDIYGASSNEATQAGTAFDAVGIGNGQGGNYNETLPSNPGSEFLLVYSTDPADPNSLYRTTSTTATALSKTILNSKPSVTDDGSAAVFVGGDSKIHVIVTDPNATQQGEFILQDEAIWSNAVISKGGNRLAAVTTSHDKSIHVYDFTSEKWASFELYNPTFSEGITSGGPLYSDALEWDYTGEYLVYDAFNSLTNSSGTNIEYWDVNFIHVWDIDAKNFSDGEVSKLFSSLPDGVSIGNPSFAKTTPNVIAFDYVDGNTNEYAVLGMNIETNDVNVIVSNNSLGWPSYNKGDTQVAFTTDDGGGNTLTNLVVLNSDKISATGSVTKIFDLSKWPVYFSVGDRGVGDDEVTGILPKQKPVTLTCYPNPFVEDISLELPKEFLRASRIEITDLVGKPVADFEINRNIESSVSLNFNNLPSGQYILHVQSAKTKGSCKVVKIK